ncbi:DUF1447 family protein [Planococcaceae bacterium Storch 2/2-2]|nr:DUF1447 family protein [Planococcaceae bacterium Storch 2/2-2]
MIYKVLYQENVHEVPVRENTKSMYIEASSVQEVRQLLANEPINIEFIQLLEGAHLEYEQAKEDFQLTEVANAE